MGEFLRKYRSTTIYFFACLNLGFFSNFPFLLSSFFLYSFLGCINLCLLSIFPFTSCFSPFYFFIISIMHMIDVDVPVHRRGGMKYEEKSLYVWKVFFLVYFFMLS